jgi:hypothetical protein
MQENISPRAYANTRTSTPNSKYRAAHFAQPLPHRLPPRPRIRHDRDGRLPCHASPRLQQLVARAVGPALSATVFFVTIHSYLYGCLMSSVFFCHVVLPVAI